MARNPCCCWISSSRQKPRGKTSFSPPVRRDCKHNKSCLVEKQCRIVIWDCLSSHTAFAHVDGWRQNMTFSYIITPNTMSFFARGEQERANVLHETWGMKLWWQQDVTAAIEMDVLDCHLCWGDSSDPELCRLLDIGTLEEMCSKELSPQISNVSKHVNIINRQDSPRQQCDDIEVVG